MDKQRREAPQNILGSGPKAVGSATSVASRVKVLCLNVRGCGGRRLSALPLGEEAGSETAGTILRASFGGWTLLAAHFPQGHSNTDTSTSAVASVQSAETCFAIVASLSSIPLLAQAKEGTVGSIGDFCLRDTTCGCVACSFGQWQVKSAPANGGSMSGSRSVPKGS